MTYEQHTLSAAFPSMSAVDFESLKKDIEMHGQREPIMLFEGKVLDGWHRYRACTDLGIKPVQFNFSGPDPVEFVVSHNLHRRHLTPSQRAAAVVACSDWAPRGKPKTGTSSGLARDADMAKIAGTSDRTIRDAKTAHKAGLTDAVKDGAITVKEAAKIARGTPTEAPKPEPVPVLQSAAAPGADDAWGGTDVIDDLERENKALQAQVAALSKDDTKAELARYVRMYEDAQRKQSELMDKVAHRDRELQKQGNTIKRIGKAVGEENPSKVAAAVEAALRKMKEPA